MSFDDLNRNIDEFGKKLESLGGRLSYTLDDLFTDDFMRRYTDHATLNEMTNKSGIQNAEEVNSVKWNDFIARTTKFASWDEMLKVGVAEWLKRRGAS